MARYHTHALLEVPISLVRQWFLFMNNIQLFVIKHLLGVKHPFPSCGDIGIGANNW